MWAVMNVILMVIISFSLIYSDRFVPSHYVKVVVKENEPTIVDFNLTPSEGIF